MRVRAKFWLLELICNGKKSSIDLNSYIVFKREFETEPSRETLGIQYPLNCNVRVDRRSLKVSKFTVF